MAKRSSKKSSKPASPKSSKKQSYSLGGIIVTLLLVLIYWGMTGSLPNVATPESSDANAPVAANADAEAVQPPATLAPLSTETTPAVAVAAVATEVATTQAVADESTPTVMPAAEVATEEPAQEELPTATAIPTDPPPTAIPATDTPAATATAPPKPTATPTNPPRAGPRGMPEIYPDALPPEALETIDLIFADGPFPFDRDGITFQNREGLLPNKPRGYYREFTVITPGASTRGARRIIAGDDGELYYTDDHYESFSWVVLP